MVKKLIDILIANSLQINSEPVFKLASGIKSDTYIDCKKTTLTAEGAYLIGNIFFEKISNLNIDAIGGLTLGADSIAQAVAYTSYIKGCPINAFIVRKEPKEHGLKHSIEGNIKKGQRVVIVDDVVTTGQSTIKAIQRAREAGLQIIKVIVLVDRQEGGRKNIEDQNVEFEAIITKQDLKDACHH